MKKQLSFPSNVVRRAAALGIRLKPTPFRAWVAGLAILMAAGAAAGLMVFTRGWW
jgi:hypothetical protein